MITGDYLCKKLGEWLQQLLLDRLSSTQTREAEETSEPPSTPPLQIDTLSRILQEQSASLGQSPEVSIVIEECASLSDVSRVIEELSRNGTMNSSWSHQSNGDMAVVGSVLNDGMRRSATPELTHETLGSKLRSPTISPDIDTHKSRENSPNVIIIVLLPFFLISPFRYAQCKLADRILESTDLRDGPLAWMSHRCDSTLWSTLDFVCAAQLLTMPQLLLAL